MSKFISTQRIFRGIRGLANWRSQVDSQGAMHLWHILSAKRQGVNNETEHLLLESHDKNFFDEFMRLQNTKEPYFDPLTSDFRIRSHYHSNVATARKKTFAAVWKAA
jgi:5-methylcytosine-specific restriction enzyme B